MPTAGTAVLTDCFGTLQQGGHHPVSSTVGYGGLAAVHDALDAGLQNEKATASNSSTRLVVSSTWPFCFPIFFGFILTLSTFVFVSSPHVRLVLQRNGKRRRTAARAGRWATAAARRWAPWRRRRPTRRRRRRTTPRAPASARAPGTRENRVHFAGRTRLLVRPSCRTHLTTQASIL